jgi:hypothetical protein
MGLCAASGKVQGKEHGHAEEGDDEQWNRQRNQRGDSLGHAAHGHAPVRAHQAFERDQEQVAETEGEQESVHTSQLAQKRDGPSLV